jgi:hypothetical protein
MTLKEFLITLFMKTEGESIHGKLFAQGIKSIRDLESLIGDE